MAQPEQAVDLLLRWTKNREVEKGYRIWTTETLAGLGQRDPAASLLQ
jgi:hypothetical protein